MSAVQEENEVAGAEEEKNDADEIEEGKEEQKEDAVPRLIRMCCLARTMTTRPPALMSQFK